MEETYCGIKFRTIFNKKAIPNDPNIPELVGWCRQFNASGFTPKYDGGSCGNLSFRSDNGFIVSCSQADFSVVDENDFVELLQVDLIKKEVLVNGKKEPSAESFMHNEIYKRRKDINAIFHGHSNEFLTFGQKLNLPMTKKEYPGGSIELMKEVAKILDNNNFILLKNHGFLSLGDSMGTAGNLAVKRYTQLQRVKNLIQ